MMGNRDQYEKSELKEKFMLLNSEFSMLTLSENTVSHTSPNPI